MSTTAPQAPTQPQACQNTQTHLAEQDRLVAASMGQIKVKLVVLSGKGGVGKSTVAANLACHLASTGRRVGLLDVDLHGPSIPRLLGLTNQPVLTEGDKLCPVPYGDNLKVMSIGFLVGSGNDPVIWRGPKKAGVIRQFLSDVAWGDLDVLVIDAPPGTGDEPLTVAQSVGKPAGAVIVTTPQDVAVDDVRRSVTFCRSVGLAVVGIVENMSGLVCPHCGTALDVFKSGGGERLAQEMSVRFLGRIPLDPQIVTASDLGQPDSHETVPAMRPVFEQIARVVDQKDSPCVSPSVPLTRSIAMKIAVPVAEGLLSPHFGHCPQVALIEVDPSNKRIVGTQMLDSPPHEPGKFPVWIAQQGASKVIAGGMGQRALMLFAQAGIEVIVGAPNQPPQAVVQAYLDGKLQTGGNVCNHEEGSSCAAH